MSQSILNYPEPEVNLLGFADAIRQYALSHGLERFVKYLELIPLSFSIPPTETYANVLDAFNSFTDEELNLLPFGMAESIRRARIGLKKMFGIA